MPGGVGKKMGNTKKKTLMTWKEESGAKKTVGGMTTARENGFDVNGKEIKGIELQAEFLHKSSKGNLCLDNRRRSTGDTP